MGRPAKTFGNITDNAILLTMEQAKERYSLCYQTIMKLAKESGALIKIGKSTRFNRQKLDEYITREYTE